MEQPSGLGRDQQRQRVDGARGLPHQRDIARIAAKAGNIVLDEAKCLHVVEQRVVAGVGLRAGVQWRHLEVAQNVEPVVGRDHHGVGRPCQRSAVVDGISRVARDGTPAMQEQQHRQLVLRGGWAPDIEGQAVLAAYRRAQGLANRVVKPVVGTGAVDAAHLQAGTAKTCGVTLSGPGGWGCGRLPAQLAHGWLGKRNTFPRVGAGHRTVVHTAQGAVHRLAHLGRRAGTTAAAHHCCGRKHRSQPLQTPARIDHVLSPWGFSGMGRASVCSHTTGRAQPRRRLWEPGGVWLLSQPCQNTDFRPPPRVNPDPPFLPFATP